jgi:hypothetical protein
VSLISAMKRTVFSRDKNPAFLVPFVAFLGLLIFISAIEPALYPPKENNVFRQWEKKLPAGLTGLQPGDLVVCAQWEAEQRKLLHRWQVACCTRGFELMRPGLDDNKFYTDVIVLGPRIVPLLAKRLEWDKRLANPEFISDDVANLLARVAGAQAAAAADGHSSESWAMNRF